MENSMTVTETRKQNTAVWIAQGILCLAFGIAGVMKLTLSMEALTAILMWPGAMPEEVVRLIGVAELAGALGLVLPMLTGIRPILTSYAAFGLMVLMIGAVGYHLMLFQGGMLIPSIILGVLAAYVGVRRMP
ncbi:MAG: DoxX family protein [Flavobacteriales bacterium]